MCLVCDGLPGDLVGEADLALVLAHVPGPSLRDPEAHHRHQLLRPGHDNNGDIIH